MLKVVLVLIAAGMTGEPVSIEIEQPSIEACAEQVNIKLNGARYHVDKTKYLAAMCVIAKGTES